MSAAALPASERCQRSPGGSQREGCRIIQSQGQRQCCESSDAARGAPKDLRQCLGSIKSCVSFPNPHVLDPVSLSEYCQHSPLS